MVARVVTAAEVPDILAATCQQLEHFAIGFVKIEGNEDDALPAGSGTLVTAGSCHAILTADHVIDALPTQGEFGLVFPVAETQPRLHRYRIAANAVRKIQVAKASYDQHGPDLALLVLGRPDVSKLEATKTFYNLDKRRGRMLTDPPPIENGGWFLVGVAAEWTSDLPLERGFTRIKAFRGLCGAGVVTLQRSVGDYDYLHFEAKYSGLYEGPQSYQGFSGGGVWQIQLKDTDGKLEILDVLLSGVAFYQSELIGDLRTIYCHGRRSVYENAWNALANCKAS